MTAATLPELTHEEMRRYSRHLILPEVAIEGQQKLKAARVLLIGAGGLGSPLALYLAAAGVGTLGPRRLRRRGRQQPAAPDPPRHQRHRPIEARVGARPDCRRESERAHRVARDAAHRDNALEIIRDYDIVVDGTDNFATRYLTNDACVLLGKPNVYGSIFRFEGQASVFATEDGPCYRCLYPGAAAAGPGAELRRGRCARRAARPDRHDPGDRGDQADPRHRRAADRPAAAGRRRACSSAR